MNRLSLWIGVAVVAAVTLYLFFGSPSDPVMRFKLAVMYVAVIVILLYALVVLIAIATGEISIAALLSEAGGGASMSRFQLLIFTLTIALCFVLIVVAGTPPSLPKIPTEVLELLGVSASTYAVSKGIQASSDMKPKTQDPAAGNPAANTPPPGANI